MLFRVVKNLPSVVAPNTCYLLEDDWDDYSFQTKFILFYYDATQAQKRIGPVKIMQLGQEKGRVKINQKFEALDNSYCSLGQEQSYYEEIRDLPEKIKSDILIALRDCIYDSNIYRNFKNDIAMRASLLRVLSYDQIFPLFKSILDNYAKPTPYHFSFWIDENTENGINIVVKPFSNPPTNVHVLIGRNGVGKTRLLSGIADKITENKKDNDFSLSGKIIFHNIKQDRWLENTQEDRFANLVTIAFSPFDMFTPIAKDHIKGNTRYDYVGLKKTHEPNQHKTFDELNAEFTESLDICLSGQRKERWINAIKTLSTDPIFADHDIQNLSDSKKDITRIFSKLSSGHKIILLSITKLVELVEEKTLILIDEPENHLHPPLLSSYIRALSDLLIQRNGVALIATHSPVILQEVPRSCVTIIDKFGSEYSFRKPDIETFGESIGTLTREVFKLEIIDSNYHKLIDQLLISLTYEELLEKLNNSIGSEGRTLARAIIASKKSA